MTTREAAAAMGLSYSWFRRKIADGDFKDKYIRHVNARMVLVHEKAVKEYLESVR